MSEQLGNGEDVRSKLRDKTIDEDTDYRNRMERIRRGEPTWLMLAADGNGETYNYYVNGEYVAQIGFDYETSGDIEIHRIEPDTQKPVLISTRDSLEVAVGMVEMAFPPNPYRTATTL